MKFDEETRKAIVAAADDGMHVSDLEAVGLAPRIINALEKYRKCVTLHDLLQMRDEDFKGIKAFDTRSKLDVQTALGKIKELREKQDYKKARLERKVQLYRKRVMKHIVHDLT